MNKAIVNLEHEIAAFIGKDNGATVHFRYDGFKDTYTVSAFTVNDKNKEVFLLKSITAEDYIEALKRILQYVKELKGMSSFTVRWNKLNSDTPIQVSYFYCHDVKDVVEKFFADKNVVDYIVYEIKLNPIS